MDDYDRDGRGRGFGGPSFVPTLYSHTSQSYNAFATSAEVLNAAKHATNEQRIQAQHLRESLCTIAEVYPKLNQICNYILGLTDRRHEFFSCVLYSVCIAQLCEISHCT